ncbi:hypothetical protein [Alicyclobacillus contaminans]|nr:hypothetical protein [Alicyclobacillus contaminans]
MILMIPVHSLFNLTTVRLGKKSILTAEACVTVTGVVDSFPVCTLQGCRD